MNANMQRLLAETLHQDSRKLATVQGLSAMRATCCFGMLFSLSPLVMYLMPSTSLSSPFQSRNSCYDNRLLYECSVYRDGRVGFLSTGWGRAVASIDSRGMEQTMAVFLLKSGFAVDEGVRRSKIV